MPTTIIGYAVGRFHIRYLAFRGGESKYPDPIPETVEAYRDQHYVEELQRSPFGALLMLFVTLNIALSAVTVGMFVGHFGIGYYFATKVIRGLADVEGADKPQIFDTDEGPGTSTSQITSSEQIDSVDEENDSSGDP